MNVSTGHFYFLDESYFVDFPDLHLMSNKGLMQDRPCFYAFRDAINPIFWMIPFSSKLTKFKAEHAKKIAKHGRCDTIVFGKVLGFEKAFLIQNMCPVTKKYIKSEYLDSAANMPVRVDGRLEKKLIQAANRVLNLQRQGVKLIFPDILKIERELLKNFC
ncbi:MAG: hypothetical protein LBE35_02700 [Clostridiales bacterium]|jgi:hypothetical protein|nr:hypothetical protein [Clostridiales bacterium]